MPTSPSTTSTSPALLPRPEAGSEPQSASPTPPFSATCPMRNLQPFAARGGSGGGDVAALGSPPLPSGPVPSSSTLDSALGKLADSPPMPRSPDHPKRNVFVKNLPKMVDPAEFKQLFESFGTVTASKLIVDIKTGAPRGFGFVQFERPQDAAAAVQGLHNFRFHDQVLSVAVADGQTREPGEPTARVFLRNVPVDATVDEVRRLVGECGNVLSVEVRPDGGSGAHVMACVVMSSPDEALHVVAAFNNSRFFIDGGRFALQGNAQKRPMQVKVLDKNTPNWPQPRASRGGGRGGGGRSTQLSSSSFVAGSASDRSPSASVPLPMASISIASPPGTTLATGPTFHVHHAHHHHHHHALRGATQHHVSQFSPLQPFGAPHVPPLLHPATGGAAVSGVTASSGSEAVANAQSLGYPTPYALLQPPPPPFFYHHHHHHYYYYQHQQHQDAHFYARPSPLQEVIPQVSPSFDAGRTPAFAVGLAQQPQQHQLQQLPSFTDATGGPPPGQAQFYHQYHHHATRVGDLPHAFHLHHRHSPHLAAQAFHQGHQPSTGYYMMPYDPRIGQQQHYHHHHQP